MTWYPDSLSVRAVPAMSRCTQGVSSLNSARNCAAVMDPAFAPPVFFTSATWLLFCSLVLLVHGELPYALSRCLACAKDGGQQLLVVGEGPCAYVAKGRDNCSREGSHVHQPGNAHPAARSTGRLRGQACPPRPCSPPQRSCRSWCAARRPASGLSLLACSRSPQL